MGKHSNAARIGENLVLRCAYWLTQTTGPLTLGYSGGLDSTVLLAALIRAGAASRLTAVHVHHGLQPLADTWQQYCQYNADKLGVRFITETLSLEGQHNIESRARRARREVLLKHTQRSGALLLAHHQNDQAETLLLQLFRGAGPQGLGAMSEHSLYQGMVILRPMLGISRAHLEKVAHLWQLDWVEDPTNQDVDVDRNLIRQQLMPLLEERWPKVVNTLSRNAELQQDAATLQHELAQLDYQALVQADGGVCLVALQQLSPARQRNLLYRWVLARGWQPPSKNVLERVWQELIPARADAQPQVVWSAGSWRRFQQRLYLLSHAEAATPEENKVVQLADGARYAWGAGVLHVSLGVSNGVGAVVPQHWSELTLAPAPKGAKLNIEGMHRELREVWRAQGMPTWRRLQAPTWHYQEQLVGAYGLGTRDEARPKKGGPAWVLNWHWNAPELVW